MLKLANVILVYKIMHKSTKGYTNMTYKGNNSQFNSIISLIREMSSVPSLFSVSPSIDFTRNRIFTFENTICCILGMAGNSLNKELYDFFKDKEKSATSSAFVQQRAKILPEAFEYLFHEFNSNLQNTKTYKGYNLFAVDGTDVNIFKNEKDVDSYIVNGNNEGFNQLHINALYNICNRTYFDTIIQDKHKTNEINAAIQMVKRNNFDKKSILIADRGYESFNLVEYCNRKSNLDYLIRVKNANIREITNLPMAELDKTISIEIRTTQKNEDKIAYKNKTAHYLSGKSKFGKYKKSQTWDFEEKCIIKIRVVRFKITDSEYETVITSLNRSDFSLEEIKLLYHQRWGIETSFRELKYALGLVNFHSKKKKFILQEIYAKMLMYNYSECIINNIVVKQDKQRKWLYQVNFTMGFYICMDYFRNYNSKSPPDLENLISRYILPIRPERRDKRKLKTKYAVGFLYRVA